MSKLKLLVTVFSLISVVGFTIWQVSKSEESSINQTGNTWNSSSASNIATEVKPDASNVSGSFTKKMLDLETYLSKNPNDTTHIIMLARLYQDGHKPDKDVYMYQKLLALHKTNPQLWLDLTNSYGMIGNWTAAAKICEDMLVLFPENTSAMYNLGAIYANQGNKSAAILWWNKVLQFEKDDAHVKHLAQQGLTKLASSM